MVGNEVGRARPMDRIANLLKYLVPYAWASQNWIPSNFCHTSIQDMSSRPVFSDDHEYGLIFFKGSIFLHDFPVQRPRLWIFTCIPV